MRALLPTANCLARAAFLLAVLGLVWPVAGQERRRPSPEEFLKRADANNNGVLEPEEITGGLRRYLERFAEEEKLNLDRPIKISKLVQIMEKRREQRDQEREQERSGDDRRGNREQASAPLVPGFGPPDDAPVLEPVPGFDVPLELASARGSRSIDGEFSEEVVKRVDEMLKRYDIDGSGALERHEWDDVRWRDDPNNSDTNRDGVLSRRELMVRISKIIEQDAERDARRREERSQRREAERNESSSSSREPSRDTAREAPASSDDRTRRYAQGLIARYDLNKNGKLEKEEWEAIRGGNYGAADKNGDGVITEDEMVAYLTSFARGGSSAQASGGSNAPTRSTEASTATYRFRTPTERLPNGLPEWFVRSDANGDGQVMMHEFSATWDATTAEEFAKYDLNGDGVITAAEAVAAQSAPSREGTTASRGTATPPREGYAGRGGDTRGAGDSRRGGDSREVSNSREAPAGGGRPATGRFGFGRR